MFSCRYCEIFKYTYFEEHLRTAASRLWEENSHSPCFVLPMFFRFLWKKKSIWVKPGRTDRWWQNLSNDKLVEEEWKKNLRISKANFLKLVNLIKPYAKERSSRVRQDVISLEKRVAIALYYPEDQGSMEITSNTFGIAPCTVRQVIQEKCGILTKDIVPEFIKIPIEKDEVLESVFQFQQRFGFPQVIRCIDGMHIPIKQPSENSHDYYSYKLRYTLNCQAICNAYGQFINVEVKWAGSVHDTRVFANCDIQKGFTNEKFKLFYKELVPGKECVLQILLGDPAYLLLPYMMKEFEHCKSNKEVIFN